MSTPLTDMLRRQTAALERAREQWQREAGEQVVATIRETWPDVGGRWPYATGESIAGWVHAPGRGADVRVSNDVTHHMYTESGYTFRGPYTARSYRGEDYSATAVLNVEPALAQLLTDLIGGAYA